MRRKACGRGRVCIVALLAAVFSIPAAAEQVPLTILHTNDVHSHYKPDLGPFGLGGIARIATTIRRIRAATENSLLLDGGDWSEGHIYYNLDAGRTALEMLNTLGYDAAVIGNHDWLAGPDQLLKLLTEVPPKFTMLGANLDFSKYSRAGELSKYVQPYQILKVGPLKVAVIGLLTYELIYDKYFAPIEIKDPFGLTRKLAAQLKKEADLVVVISHNGMSTNKLIAGLPNVDIVIHAHDHEKLPQPVTVERNGKTAILVEAHHWGFYVGRLDLTVDTETKKYAVKRYELIQMDDTIPDDPDVASLVNNYDRQLVQKYGDIFHDRLAETKIDIRRESAESLYGNLLTDAYREFTGAEVSFEQIGLTSGELFKGPLRTVDIYNALTAIYDPLIGKSWTLKTLRMTGETLSWVMNLVLSISSYAPGGLISVSGVHAVYDPVTSKRVELRDIFLRDDSKKPLKSLEIAGAPVDPKRSYLVAMPQGLMEAIDFIEKFWGNKIERSDVRDTGVEDWRVLATYLQNHSPIDGSKIPRGGRISLLQSDLALYHDDISFDRRGARVSALVTVRNLGTTVSSARTLTVTHDKTPAYIVDDPNPAETDNTYKVPPIAPGRSVAIQVALELPAQYAAARVPLYFMLDHAADDPNKSNDGTWVMATR